MSLLAHRRGTVFLFLALALVPPLAAADAPTVVIGRFSEMSPNDIGVPFPATPINKTAYLPCWYACFQFTAGACDASGTITLSKSPSLPFRAKSFRKGTPWSGCDGTPVSFPVSLNKEWLLVDFEFTPTAGGQFSDALIYGATPTGGTAGSIAFTLSGTGVADALVSVVSRPSGMLQAPNTTGATDSYALINTGSKPATITLSLTGDFFTQSPASFTIPAGGIQRVTLAATAKPVGVYQGASKPAGAGVPADLSIPVQLLVANPPSGIVDPVPAVTRTDVSAPEGTNPTGSLTFTNRGTSGASGFLVSDSPWLVPPSGAIRVEPGQTLAFNFTIDRSKRPDASDLTGSVEGRLSLNYLSGPVSSLVVVPNATPPPASSGATIVDTVKPAVDTAAAPALQTGETAIVLPSVLHRGSLATDILLSNFSDAANSGALFFFTPTGGASSFRASIGTMLPNSPVAFGDIVKNVFGSASLSGSLQIRTTGAASISATSRMLNLANPSGTFGTALPTMRSDAAIAAGGSIFLAGLQRDGGTHTDLYIQELGGANASVSVEFFNTSGALVGTKTTSALTRFGILEQVNAVPSGAVSARITNVSGSAGKIGAHAIVYDDGGSDLWSIPAASYSAAVVIPNAAHAKGASSSFTRTDLSIMNTTATTATGKLQYVATGVRSRAIRRSGASKTESSAPPTPDAVILERTVSLGALQSQKISNILGSLFNVTRNVEGYLVFTPTAGSFALASRTYETSTGFTGTRGTSVPALPVASLLKNGQVKRIGGLEDSAARTSAKGSTYSTDIALMETAGAAVTMRVTLRYAYALQSVQAQATATRDFKLDPREFLLVENIGTAMIGTARAELGDLHKLQVDIQVISGTGSVAVFTRSTDNGSGDSILRVE